MSYGRPLGFWAKRDPDAKILHFEGRSQTRIELERRSNRLARVYRELGVTPGARVTIALPNGIEFFEA